jgi:hypothetical protein
LQAQNHSRNARTLVRIDAKVRDERQRGGRMSRVKFTMNDLVTNARPARLAAKFHGQIIFLKQTRLFRQNNWRAIRVRNKSQL